MANYCWNMEGRVARISIAPVKSLGLVHPEGVDLVRGGARGDRRFWLVDEDRRLYNLKRNGSMLRIRPQWDEATQRLALDFPDGARVDGVVELGEDVAGLKLILDLLHPRLPLGDVVFENLQSTAGRVSWVSTMTINTAVSIFRTVTSS